jgi:hypothetical protein
MSDLFGWPGGVRRRELKLALICLIAGVLGAGAVNSAQADPNFTLPTSDLPTGYTIELQTGLVTYPSSAIPNNEAYTDTVANAGYGVSYEAEFSFGIGPPMAFQVGMGAGAPGWSVMLPTTAASAKFFSKGWHYGAAGVAFTGATSVPCLNQTGRAINVDQVIVEYPSGDAPGAGTSGWTTAGGAFVSVVPSIGSASFNTLFLATSPAVPEPTSMSLLGLCAAALLLRRRSA